MGPLQKSKSPIRGHPTPALSSLSPVSSSSESLSHSPVSLTFLSSPLSFLSTPSAFISCTLPLSCMFLVSYPSLFLVNTRRSKAKRRRVLVVEEEGRMESVKIRIENNVFFPLFFKKYAPSSVRCTSSDNVRLGSLGK